MGNEFTMAARRRMPPRARAGAVVLCVLVICSLAAPVLAPYGPNDQNLHADLAKPGVEHLLGCDKLGRDQLSRLLFGARVSLIVGLCTVGVSVLIGLAVGAVAGYAGGVTDFWLMRLVDMLLAFPGLLFAIALAAVMGPGLPNVVIALSAIGWPGYARLVRGEVRALRSREHVEAAIALGTTARRVVVHHVLPMVMAPLSVQATFGIAAAIVGEASLSFLGLGVQPPNASWGAMINDGRSFLLVAPHLTVFPGTAIFVTVLALHSVGDALRARMSARPR